VQLKARYQQKRRQRQASKAQIKRAPIEPMEWCQSHAVLIKSNTTEKKAPPDQSPD